MASKGAKDEVDTPFYGDEDLSHLENKFLGQQKNVLAEVFAGGREDARYAREKAADEARAEAEKDPFDVHSSVRKTDDDESARSRVLVPQREEFVPALPPVALSGRRHNTGVKGVLADKEEADILWKIKLERDRLSKLETMRKMTTGVRSKDPSVSYATTGDMHKKVLADDSASPSDSDSETDSEDEAFFRQYRAERMQHLKQTMARQCEVRAVTGEEMVEAVESGASKTVVVHIYESFVQGCEKLNRCLDELARKYPGVKFLKLRGSQVLGTSFDHIACPALNIYRQGELLHCLVRVTDPLPTLWGVNHVQALLAKHDVFAAPSAAASASASASAV